LQEYGNVGSTQGELTYLCHDRLLTHPRYELGFDSLARSDFRLESLIGPRKGSQIVRGFIFVQALLPTQKDPQ
jgi:hypothetical protein